MEMPTPNTLAEQNLDLARSVARKYARADGARQDDLASVGMEALLDAAHAFDPGRGVPFRPFAVQRIEWAVLKHLRRERQARSLDAPPADDPDGEPLSGRLEQAREDDPAALAELSERLAPEGRKKYSAMRLSECEVRTPVEEAGQWVARLRAACFDAVTESDMTEVMKKVLEKAKRGNLQATKLLLDYLAGGRGCGVRQTVIVQQAVQVEPEGD